ncbi:hypothetical protein ANSO36C_48670 [Nostoc cf. commune SO-36]|uniref:Uncharacterized protein n=1 Tax=Nostoc cf. commune SO-36 TaxID=449208 RepID=A0ABM7Z7E0_NOSCO|nr:hypothetical protein ANSO36C_48670 [Nostoc cf. commune SO-36]
MIFLGVFRPKFINNNVNLTQSSNITDTQAVSLNPSYLENALKQHPIVRGIATNLSNRSLVLVTTDNEILDILTPQQQVKLENRIINEVANYWQYWRLIEAKKETQLLPQIDSLLAKLTDINTAKALVLADRIPKDLLNTDRLLAFLDITVAKLESNALVPVQERSQEVVQLAQTQLNIFLYGKEQLAANREIAATADNLENSYTEYSRFD